MIVLDTNVVSELMRPQASLAVVGWIDHQPAGDIWLSSITLAELLYGVGRLPQGRRKTALAELLEEMVVDDFDRRIAPFDAIAAAHYADIVVSRERSGRPISVADAQIAAICRSNGAALVTRNTADFAGTDVSVIDPWVAPDR